MEKENSLKYFLGANTPDGFVSFYENLIDLKGCKHLYIIKGGPGTGKSSMMKQLAAFFAEKGEKIELCPCSSDPDSLDAVIFHGKKTVILDGGCNGAVIVSEKKLYLIGIGNKGIVGNSEVSVIVIAACDTALILFEEAEIVSFFFIYADKPVVWGKTFHFLRVVR